MLGPGLVRVSYSRCDGTAPCSRFDLNLFYLCVRDDFEAVVQTYVCPGNRSAFGVVSRQIFTVIHRAERISEGQLWSINFKSEFTTRGAPEMISAIPPGIRRNHRMHEFTYFLDCWAKLCIVPIHARCFTI